MVKKIEGNGIKSNKLGEKINNVTKIPPKNDKKCLKNIVTCGFNVV
jgi:hypothetical protein